MVEKIIRPYRCTKVLPAVYDETLSYYEAIAKLCAKINEVIDELDTIGEGILAEANAYTDKKIADTFEAIDVKIQEVNRLIDEINENYATFVNYVNEEIDNLIAEVNGKVREINQRVQQLDDKFTSEIQATNDRMVVLIEQNNDYLIRELSKNLAKLRVVNYFTGEEVSIQDMFDYLAQLHVDDSINYNTMATRAKTYTQLANLNINYTNLVLHSNTLYV